MKRRKVFVDSDVVLSSLISSKGAAHFLLNEIESEFVISNISLVEITRGVTKLDLSIVDLNLLKTKLKTVNKRGLGCCCFNSFPILAVFKKFGVKFSFKSLPFDPSTALRTQDLRLLDILSIMSKVVFKGLIVARLREIEEKEQVRILYAVESGSRGWGFESKDSDYDVRFIYAHPLDWYLSIGKKRDVIEYPISDSLDISGWDIKKALKLFKDSNPPLYEWLNSPIVYVEEDNFTRRLRALMPTFYSSASSLHHYLHMAQSNYKSYFTGPKVKVKKYFYVLRPIFACMWIETEKSMPPMEFEKLFSAQKLTRDLANEIKKLLVRKRAGVELGTEDRNEVIDQFLAEKLTYFENYSKTLTGKRPLKESFLDDLFRGVIKSINI